MCEIDRDTTTLVLIMSTSDSVSPMSSIDMIQCDRYSYYVYFVLLAKLKPWLR